LSSKNCPREAGIAACGGVIEYGSRRANSLSGKNCPGEVGIAACGGVIEYDVMV
jgi:hypothetical protein